MTTIVYKTTRRIWLRVLLVVAALSAAGLGGWTLFFRTYHYRKVHEGHLYRDGLRQLSEFSKSLAASRAKTVICLLDESERQREPFKEEEAFCHRAHVDFIPLPVRLGGWPTTEQIQEFLKLAANPRRQPLLVHCAQGVRRTGMFVAAYQMSILNYDKDRTKAAIETFGHSDRTVNDIKRFIDVYDPQSRTVTTTLEPSSE